MNTMLKQAAIGAAILIANASGAFAETPDWSFAGFRQQSFNVGVATDKSGHRMMVIKMKDGTMMAVVPAAALWTLMKDTPDSMLQ